MSRIAGRRPKASGQISTPGWAPLTGWMKAASHTPSGVRIETAVSSTAIVARAGRAVAAQPAATDAATKPRRDRSGWDSAVRSGRSEVMASIRVPRRR